MKVGVVTFHSAFNFGATLQTWALQKALKQIGTEPCVINYHPWIIDGLYDPYGGRSGFARTKRHWYLKLMSPEKVVRVKKYSAFIRDHLNLVGDYKTYEELTRRSWMLILQAVTRSGTAATPADMIRLIFWSLPLRMPSKLPTAQVWARIWFCLLIRNRSAMP